MIVLINHVLGQGPSQGVQGISAIYFDRFLYVTIYHRRFMIGSLYLHTRVTLVNCIFLEMYLFHQDFQMHLHRVVQRSLLMVFENFLFWWFFHSILMLYVCLLPFFTN